MSNLCLIGLPEVGYIAGIAVLIFGITAVRQNPFISRGQKILWILTLVVLDWIACCCIYYTYPLRRSGMKRLITGASGFSGGFLVKEALNRGYETWAGVRSTSSRVNLQDERIRFIDLKYSTVSR